MPKLAALSVTGADAFDFLQGQLSNDLGLLKTRTEILAAWCSPKGRVLWFGTVQAIADGFALSAAQDNASDIVKRLTVFRFRAQVEFDIRDEGQTVDTAYLIENGYPYIGGAQMDRFTPHMLNLDLLGAISLDKGCYTGQEIVARTHYKGATKRRTLRFASDGDVAVGDKIRANNRDIGEVLNAAGRELLAVVPVAQADAALTAGGAALTRLELPYALD